MNCPVCAQPVRQYKDPVQSGRLIRYCGHCGWGAEKADEARNDLRDRLEDHSESSRPQLLWARRLLAWGFSLALLAGPYLWLVLSVGPMEPWVHPTYWLTMVAYVGLAFVLCPRPDMEELGWFGGLIDNPFSHEDDLNRFLLALLIFLLPGKVVCYGIAEVVNTLRGR